VNESTSSARDRWRPPLWYDRLAGVAWRGIAIVAGVALAVSIVVWLSPVVLPLFLGLLFASALRPVYGWLRARDLRPGAASAISLAVLLVALGLVGWLTVVAVADHWPAINDRIDEAVASLVDSAIDAGAESASAAEVADELREGSGTITELLVQGAVQLLPVIAAFVATLLLSLLVTFFYLKDGASMWAWIGARAGEPGPLLDRVGQRVWTALSSFILGQTAIAAIDASCITLGALVLGVPELGAIFMLTFFGAYIPYLGATLSGMLAVLLAVSDGGVSKGAWMLAVVILVQLLEGNIFQPWIQGRAMRLHPLVIALAVALGGAMAGFLGILLAVPVTAAGVVALSELRAAGYLGDVDG
jgi:predicted PurR-regulated permease PerM